MLRAVGADEDLAHSSIRFGISRFTTEEEVDYTVDRCVASVSQLREMRSRVQAEIKERMSNISLPSLLVTAPCMRW